MPDESLERTTPLSSQTGGRRLSPVDLLRQCLIRIGSVDPARLSSHADFVDEKRFTEFLAKLIEAGELSAETRKQIESFAVIVFAASTTGENSVGLSGTANLFDNDLETAEFASSDQPGADEPTGHFRDFEILHEIAKGGMGVVYKARQIKLNRLVALKMIRASQFPDSEQVKRFYTEAEAAAKLDHSGIVSVFDVGECDGQHYYTMAFVDGESLADRVHRIGPLPAKEAGQLMRDASAAVQFAHERDVLHRDIKPQNILLTQQLHVQVTDFGLAKLTKSGSELTVAGQVLGTPAFMPPEQASGKMDDVGVTADVYSLGATLYYLLTGRPPFQTQNIAETLRQVTETEPVSPRSLDPTIPRDLETICLKCLRKTASHRYETAEELGNDLERWLQGEPIKARPVGLIEKSWKWCRRRPAVASLSLSLVVLSMVAVAVSTTFGIQANQALERQQLAVTETRDTIDRLVLAVDRQDLSSNPELRMALKELLDFASSEYRRFIAEHADDAQRQDEVADRLSMLASAQMANGAFADAIDSQRQRTEILRVLITTSGQQESQFERRQKLASSLHALSGAYALTSQHAAAMDAKQQAIDEWRELLVVDPNDASTLRSLGSTLIERGFLEIQEGNLRGGREFADEGLAMLDRLREMPNERGSLDILGPNRITLGLIYHQTGDHQAGASILEDIVEDSRRSIDVAEPSPAQFGSLGGALGMLANVYDEMDGRQSDAWQTYRDAIEAFQKSVVGPDAEFGHLSALAITHYNYGISLSWEGQHELALEQFQSAADRFGQHASLFDSSDDDLALIVDSLLYVARLQFFESLGSPAQALANLENAENWFATIDNWQDKDAGMRKSHGDCIHLMADVLVELSDYGDASIRYQQALKIRKELAEQFADDYQLQKDLTATLTSMGNAAFDQGDTIGFELAYAEAMDRLEVLSAEGAPEFVLEALGKLYLNLADFRMEQETREGVDLLLIQAIQVWDVLDEAHPEHWQAYQYSTEARYKLGRFLVGEGRFEQALSPIRDARMEYETHKVQWEGNLWLRDAYTQGLIDEASAMIAAEQSSKANPLISRARHEITTLSQFDAALARKLQISLLTNEATWAHRQDQADVALAHLEQAVTLLDETESETGATFETAKQAMHCLKMMSELEASQDRPLAAQQYLDRAFQVARYLPQNERRTDQQNLWLAETLQRKSNLYRSQDQMRLAAEYQLECLRLDPGNREHDAILELAIETASAGASRLACDLVEAVDKSLLDDPERALQGLRVWAITFANLTKVSARDDDQEALLRHCLESAVAEVMRLHELAYFAENSAALEQVMSAEFEAIRANSQFANAIERGGSP